VKNSRANPFFKVSASFSKLLNNKKYIISAVNSGHPLFSRQAQVVKNPECKKYIQYSEKFQGNPVFRASTKLLKNAEW